MAEAPASDSRSGETAAGDDRGSLKSPRQRAAHYRGYAAQIRALAEGEKNGALHAKLLEIACEYEELAKDLEPRPD
jgi:hypothetical protein